MDGFDAQLLARLPLAQAVLELFDHVLDDGLCGQVFDTHRGRCYQDELRFPTLVRVIRDALVLHGGSANRAIGDAVDAGRLECAPSGVYRKLANLPPALSQALLRRATARLAALAADTDTDTADTDDTAGTAAGRTLPACFDDLDVVVVDGKKAKRAPKRLAETRAFTSGSLLGAKLLVGLSLRSGLAVAMNADEDGERNDVPLVGGLLGQLRSDRVANAAAANAAAAADPVAAAAAESARPFLFVATRLSSPKSDRQFADLNLPALFTAGGDHFLLRCAKTLKFEPDPSRPAQCGVDQAGRTFTQAWGWVGSAKDGRRRYVRRVTLARPDANGGKGDDVILITDLLDESAYPAAALLALYRLRWTIEEAFQQVTKVFALAKLIGAAPRGIIFQGALCLLIYNLTLTVKGYVAKAGQKRTGEVSTENLFYDLSRELTAWSVLGGGASGDDGDDGGDDGDDTPVVVLPPPAPREAAAMRQRLRELLGTRWNRRWLKKADRRPRTPKAKRPLPGGHASVWKLMQAAKRERAEKS
jgi:hypothetical protein